MGMIALAVSLSALASFSQDAHFSQYYASSLYLNPSMAGVEPNQSFSSNFRQQWKSIIIPYVTSQVSFIQPIHSKATGKDVHLGGVGLSLYNDRAGDGNFKTIGVNVNAAYNLYLNSSQSQCLIFGLQGGMVQKRIDYTNLTWGEQFNPYIGGGYDFSLTVNPDDIGVNMGKVYADVGAGLIYYFNSKKQYKNMPISGFVGYSGFHLNRPNESFYDDYVAKLSILHKAHAGMEVHVSEKVNISPNVLVMTQFGRMHYNTGIYLTYRMIEQKNTLKPTDLILGGWYRLKDSFIASVGISNNNYTLGFSYDINNSNLRYETRGRGSYEISFSIRKMKESKYRRFNTPRI
jgi:type IX secretion system PorP/SprF family membrane protein